MLHLRFVQHVVFDSGFAAGRIEEFLLDCRVNNEFGADLLGNFRFFVFGTRALKLFEQCFDLAMVIFYERNCIHACSCGVGIAVAVFLVSVCRRFGRLTWILFCRVFW